MSGLKTNWQTGDVVTAEKLNAMQYAMVDMLYNESLGKSYLNLKAGELLDLLNAGTPVFIKTEDAGATIYGVVAGGGQASGGYTFMVLEFTGQSVACGCESADDYPVQGYTPNQNS